MRDELREFPTVRLRPIFVEVMPPFDSIKDGELWISHSRLMKNASLGNSERAGAGIEAPLDADSEEAAPWGAPDRATGASG